MSTTAAQVTLVTGRVVWGDLFKGTPKLDDNDQPVIDPETGNQVIEYAFGLAVPKSEFTQDKMGPGGPAEIWAIMQRQAMLAYGNQQPPDGFSWKYKDGDGRDHNGKPFADRKGYAGHFVFTMSTRIPFEVVKWNGDTQRYYPVREGVKCGDYVQVQVNIKAHSGNPQKRNSKGGVYLNPLAVLFVGFGEEIVNGPTAEMRFGSQPPALPPGASATPLAPANSPLLAMPGVPQGGQQQMAPAYGGYPQNNQAPQAPYGMPGPSVPQVAPVLQATPSMPVPGMPQQPMAQAPGNGYAQAPQGVAQVDPNYGVLPPHLQPQAQQMPGAQGVAMPMVNQQSHGVPSVSQPSNGGMPMPGGFPMPGQR